MGAPIAERLEQAGHELSVWNRSQAAAEAFVKRGVTLLEAPSDAWANADLVVTMLADDAAVEAVALGERGLLTSREKLHTSDGGDRHGRHGDEAGTLVDMSTISTSASARLATACERRGIRYLRAPVSGNPSVVTAGELGIIVSGPREAFDGAVPTLRDIGPNLFYVGEAEESRILKLALNLMIGGTTQLLAEALVLGERHGLERATMLEVISGSAVGSPYVKYKREMLISGDYTSTFTARLLNKDLGLALAAGHEASVPLPVTALVQQLVEGCLAMGMGDLDLAVLVPRLERDARAESSLTPESRLSAEG